MDDSIQGHGREGNTMRRSVATGLPIPARAWRALAVLARHDGRGAGRGASAGRCRAAVTGSEGPWHREVSGPVEGVKAPAMSRLPGSSAGVLAQGGGGPAQGYYRYIDSDELPDVEAPTPDFTDIRFLGTTVALVDDYVHAPARPERRRRSAVRVHLLRRRLQPGVRLLERSAELRRAVTRPFNVCPPMRMSGAGNAVFGYWDDLKPGVLRQGLHVHQGHLPAAHVHRPVGAGEPPTASSPTRSSSRSSWRSTPTTSASSTSTSPSGGPDGVAFSPAGELFTSQRRRRQGAALRRRRVLHGRTTCAVGTATSADPAYMTLGDGVDGSYGDLNGDGDDDLLVSSFANDG